MGAAGHEVSMSDSETAARRLAEEVLALVARVGTAPLLHSGDALAQRVQLS